jgi:hypothetical protein
MNSMSSHRDANFKHANATLLSNSMKRRPLEVNSRPISHEIPRLLWKSKVHSQNFATGPHPELNELVHILFNSVSMSSIFNFSVHLRLGLLFRFFEQNLLQSSHSPLPAISPAYLILLDFITLKVHGQFKLLHSSLCNYFQPPVTSSI